MAGLIPDRIAWSVGVLAWNKRIAWSVGVTWIASHLLNFNFIKFEFVLCVSTLNCLEVYSNSSFIRSYKF